MKKISLLLVLVIVTGITVFTSCTKETESTPPTISFKTGSTYTSGDATLPLNTTIKIGLTATAGSSALTRFKVVASTNSADLTLVDSTFSSNSFNNDYNLTLTELGTFRLTFTVTDAEGQTASIYFDITVTGSGEISAYSQKILGSYDNSAYGSSFASADGTVYMLAQAKANAAKVDWLYFYGAANLATIAAPDDATAASVFTSATNGLATWSVRNATRFRIVTGGAVWDNITYASDIAAIATETTETKAVQLAVGNIVAFKTAGNKLGLIKITDIQTGAAGTITYDVKVQK